MRVIQYSAKLSGIDNQLDATTMYKGCLSILALLLFGAYFSTSSGGLISLQPLRGSPQNRIDSPTEQFTAQLWYCCDFYNYISGFTVRNRKTGVIHRQDLDAVFGENTLAGGVFFEWTPSENYLVMVTDNRVTSHGCDELLVYAGDGSALVYSTISTSICRSLMADYHIAAVDLCANDDILITSGYGVTQRITPSTGVSVETGETSCGDD